MVIIWAKTADQTYLKILQESSKLLMIGSFKRLSFTDQFSDEFAGQISGPL